ncbi:manganese catalase family protein [Clostridium sp. CX1]|uniref:Manganese catalase family protein n=1 Tax=Clostridium tanneri TaxID=3037988 RepID=A0ABU4JV53_9CLOT|nr:MULTISPECIES: ferritin family protein [unclassified Clostridium]MCT8978020.1 manganese catalase family protein [Clostridium sp. CX1]MDW8802027.1 manganese catalase family protein [Clostridium sp. A1-XYC3]
MPGDISKHTKYKAEGSYPEPKVEGKNIYYANLLLQDYAGAVSEFTAVSLYSYQHFVSDDRYKEFAEIIGQISITEMKHLELLGETIKLLGVKPAFVSSVCPCGKVWNAGYVNFADKIKAMLIEDIKAETEAIRNYRYHMSVIKDKYIRKLLARIIADEEVHLRIFKKLYDKFSRC